MEGGIAHDTCPRASPGNGKGRPERALIEAPAEHREGWIAIIRAATRECRSAQIPLIHCRLRERVISDPLLPFRSAPVPDESATTGPSREKLRTRPLDAAHDIRLELFSAGVDVERTQWIESNASNPLRAANSLKLRRKLRTLPFDFDH